MSEIIRIRARLFDAAATCASTDDFRPSLRGVYVQPHPEGGAVMLATDGYRFVVVRDETGVCAEPRIILADKALRRALRSVKGDQALTVTAEGHVLVADQPELTGLTSAGDWISWQRAFTPLLDLIKTKAPAAHATFNPHYLGSFGKVAERLNPTAYQGIRVIALSDSDPALVLFPYIPDVFGVLMPMRGGNEQAFPAWFKPVLGPKKRARRKLPANDTAKLAEAA
ncbi:hypothetical protein [Brevundimonas balnearis]|uniref:DNA polymerase III beta sliding clamp central domain-containing protein n=1 Tax=Brevundimonas balnearis TaxID=1572858 RepID=A0ABV6R3M4_9CAUL